MTEKFLLGRIIKEYPKRIVDEYGHGIITSSLYHTFNEKGEIRFNGMRDKRHEELARPKNDYILMWEKCLSGNKKYERYVQEVLHAIIKDKWNEACDKHKLPKDHSLRDCCYIVFDYYFFDSNLIVELDGQHHWLIEENKLKDDIRDTYCLLIFGRKPLRLRVFGHRFTKFDKDGWGDYKTKVLDPKIVNKQFKDFEDAFKSGYSDIGYSYLIGQCEYIVWLFREQFKSSISIIEKIEEKEGIGIYTNKKTTINSLDYISEFPALASDLGKKTVSNMFRSLFEKQLIIL